MAEKKMSVQELSAKADDLRAQLRLVEQEIATRHGEDPEPEPAPAPKKK